MLKLIHPQQGTSQGDTRFPSSMISHKNWEVATATSTKLVQLEIQFLERSPRPFEQTKHWSLHNMRISISCPSQILCRMHFNKNMPAINKTHDWCLPVVTPPRGWGSWHTQWCDSWVMEDSGGARGWNFMDAWHVLECNSRMI